MRRGVQHWRYRKSTLPQPSAPTFTDIATASVTVSGDGVLGATSYEVQRSTDQVTWTTRHNGTGLTFPETGLKAGVTYYWQRRYTEGQLTSPWSSTSSMQTLQQPAPPGDPTTAPVALAVGSTTMSVGYDPVPASTGYILQRATATGGPWTQVYAGPDLSVDTTGLTPGITYYWRYAATNADGQSPGWSPLLTQATSSTAQPPATPTTAPTVSGVDAGSATMNMAAVTDADIYILGRSPDGIGSWVRRSNGFDRVFQDTGLAAATDYYYRYTVANAVGPAAGHSPNRKVTTAAISVGNVRPYSAKYIRDRSGVRVAANESSGEYGEANADAICRRVASMGFGHIRGMFRPATAASWANACKTHNLKWLILLVTEARSPNDMKAISDETVAETRDKVNAIKNSPLYSSVLGGLEGPNEPNHNRSGNRTAPDWYVQATAYQRAIWETAKSVTSTGAPSPIRSVQIVGPSLHDVMVDNSKGQHWELLKAEGIEQWCDMIGLHTYPGGSYPERKLDKGLTATQKGRLEYIKITFGNDVAVWCTEWGYHNAKLQTGHRPVPFSVAADYAPRGFLQFVTTVKPTGIVRNMALTYFESLDNPSGSAIVGIGDTGWYNSANHEVHLGMFNVPTANTATWTPKEIATGMTAFLGAMRDPVGTPDYTPNLVKCDVSSAVDGAALQWQVTATKAQSDAGTATLWIWRNKDIWNRDTLAFITVLPVSVGVTDRVGKRTIPVDGKVQRLDLR